MLIKLSALSVASFFFITDLSNVIIIIIIDNTLVDTTINISLSDCLNAALNMLSII